MKKKNTNETIGLIELCNMTNILFFFRGSLYVSLFRIENFDNVVYIQKKHIHAYKKRLERMYWHYDETMLCNSRMMSDRVVKYEFLSLSHINSSRFNSEKNTFY